LDDMALPRREVVAARLRDIVTRTRRDALDELELAHLVEVASNHTLLMADIVKDGRLSRVVRNDLSSSLGFVHDFAGPETLNSDTIRQIQRIPDDIKVVGDKCLYDVGLFGRHSYGGHDLILLGRRSYQMASEVLELLSEDRRLREFFRQNRLFNLPIEEEIVFLRHCGARFTLHAELLKDLHLFDAVPRSLD
jgi:hypothetical protein